MILGHVIQLDTTFKQANACARASGCARFTHNWGLAEWERQHAAGLKPNAFSVKKAFNSIKAAEFPWIYESPKDANQQAFADLGNAFTNFFRWQRDRKGPKVGYPTRHKKGQNDAFYVSNDKFTIRGNVVRLPVIGSVRLCESLRLSGKIVGARVFHKAGHWFMAVQVDGEHRRPTAHVRSSVGVDLGVKKAVVPSSGKPLDAPDPLKAALQKLSRANRRLHRRQKGSANRYKARMEVASIHERIANIRKDFMHKVTTDLCRQNQTVVIEDLNVRGMMQNERLARAMSDVGFGMFRQFMTYKAHIFGTELIVANRWFPSSKRCSGCGNKKDELGLHERTYVCACGLVKDRDLNAALNLEQYPWLKGNWGRKAKTPMETSASASLLARDVSAVAEVGTKPCALVRTS